MGHKSTAMAYLKDFFLADKLLNGVDFEVISFIAVEPGKPIYSIDHFLGINSKEILRFRNAKDTLLHLSTLVDVSKQKYITPTPIKKSNNMIYLYKLDVPLDIDIAVATGLGVFRMLKGEYQGKFLYYSIEQVYNDEPGDIACLINDWIRLKLYIQIMRANDFIDLSLASEWRKNRNELLKFIVGDTKIIEQILDSIFLKDT